MTYDQWKTDSGIPEPVEAERPFCAYCCAFEGLRIKCDGGGYVAPEYTCEACFTGTDTGPSFDDLPEA